MFWLGLFLVALLVLNALAHFIPSEDADRPFGTLTLVLALLGLIAHGLSASGRFLFAPEIGAMMYEGSDLRRAGLYLLLIGASFSVALVPEAVRLFVHRRRKIDGRRLGWLLVAAAAVSLVSCLRVRVLNPEDLAPLQIQAYDFFFPPLVIWSGACFLLSLAWCLRVDERFWPLLPVAWTWIFCLFSVTRDRPFDDPWTVWVWGGASLALLLALFLTGAFKKMGPPFRKKEEEKKEEEAGEPPEVRTRQRVAGAAVAGLMLSFLAVYYLTSSGLLRIELQGMVLGYLLFWLVLAELENPRTSLYGWLLRRRAPAGALPEPGKPAQDVTNGNTGLYDRLKQIFSLGNAVTALVKVALLIVVLIALSEIPNRNKTLVMPFRDLAGYESKELGEGIAEYVCYRLARFDQGLRIMPIPLSGPAPRHTSSGFTLGSGTDEAAAFASANELVISGIRIPLHLILRPIQDPMRRLLGTRVIRGSIHADAESYSLIAISTRGESWRVEAPRGEEVSDPTKEDLYGTLADLADELAFEIYSGSESLAGPRSGMTSSRSAFQSFWRGFSSLRRFDESRLSREAAIESIEEALDRDPSFALASYHLSLTRLEDGWIGQAIPTLRKTIAQVPEFIPAYNALAYTLLRWNEDEDEAEDLWKRVLLTADAEPVSLALAYHGLAHMALDLDDLLAAGEGLEEADDTEEEMTRHLRAADNLVVNTRAFYYARKAERLYAAVGTRDPRIVKRRAMALTDLGRILERRSGRFVGLPEESWSCRGQVLLFSLVAQELPSDLLAHLLEPEEGGQSSAKTVAPPSESVTWALETTHGSYVSLDPAALRGGFEDRALAQPDYTEGAQPTGQGDVWKLGPYRLVLEGSRLNVYGKVLRQSPYSGEARRYYRRAIAFDPHDATILCQLAASNYVLKKKSTMFLLRREPKMRLALSHRYAVHYPGRDKKVQVPALPAYFFELALEEYRLLLEKNPNEDVRDAACAVYKESIQRSSLRERTSWWQEALACPLDETSAAALLEPAAENLLLGEETGIYVPGLGGGGGGLDLEDFR